jgi:hypothetical protein
MVEMGRLLLVIVEEELLGDFVKPCKKTNGN